MNIFRISREEQRHLDDKLIYSAIGGEKKKCLKLINEGANVNANTGESTPLKYASSEGHKDVYKLLLDHGADVNAKFEFGGTALQYATEKGHKDVCELLLDHGADVNEGNIYGQTPLHVAAYNNYTDLCLLLIDRGADVHAVESNHGWTPLMGAFVFGNKDVCELLRFKMRQPLFELYMSGFTGSLPSEETRSYSTSMAIEEASNLASIRKRNNISRVEVDTERMGEFAYRFYNLPNHIMVKIIKDIV
jgi:ankyrin repeat protein